VTECSVHHAGLHIYKMYKTNIITLLYVKQANRKDYKSSAVAEMGDRGHNRH